MSGKKAKASKTVETAPVEKVRLSTWFSRMVKEGKLQFWQQREIETFFKEKGLSLSEEPDKYTELLKLY